MTITAATFATSDEHCGDGTTSPTGKVVVQGGTGDFTSGGCVVHLDGGEQISFQSATLTGTGVFQINGEKKAKAVFTGSSLTMGQDIVLSLSGSKGAITVEDISILQANSGGVVLDAGTGLGTTGGKATVTDSVLDSGPGDVQVRVSTDDKGKTTVRDSDLDASSGNLAVTSSSADGKTTLLGSELQYGDFNVFGAKCKSEGNTPATPCT